MLHLAYLCNLGHVTSLLCAPVPAWSYLLSRTRPTAVQSLVNTLYKGVWAGRAHPSVQSLGTPCKKGPSPLPHDALCPMPLTRLRKLECALAPLSQAHNGHHLGTQAATSLLGGGGPGPTPSLLGSADFTADAGAPNHIPGGPS